MRWDQLTPEQRAALSKELARAGSIESEFGLLDEQMRQAEALRQPGREYYGIGAGFGALGDTLRSIAGVVRHNDAVRKREPLQKEYEGIRSNYGNLAAESFAAAEQQKAAQAMSPIHSYYLNQQPGPKQVAMDDDPRVPPMLRRRDRERDYVGGYLKNLFTYG
jgi:hypothetical protein